MRRHPLSRDLYPLAVGYNPLGNIHPRPMQPPFHTLGLCALGRAILHWPGGVCRVGPGELFALRAGTPYRLQCDPRDPMRYYWLSYDGSLALAYTNLLRMERPVAALGREPQIDVRFEALLSLVTTGSTLEVFIRSACYVKALFADLAGAVHADRAAPAAGVDFGQLWRTMEINLSGGLDLDRLAAEAGLSKFHFIRRFRDVTGHTPIQYFIHMKIQSACRRLESSTDSIRRIAQECGYDDPYYFSRLFRRLIGVSPQQYRAGAAGDPATARAGAAPRPASARRGHRGTDA
ncbi:MAG: helix-turn-helix domain-containing protein [Gammaproteobacteria bacterium]